MTARKLHRVNAELLLNPQIHEELSREACCLALHEELTRVRLALEQLKDSAPPEGSLAS
jgi:hypothetical protein